MASSAANEFPQSPQSPHSPTDTDPNAASTIPKRRRGSTAASAISNASSRVRAASIKLMDADPPLGMWAATGSTIARAPTIGDIRTGSFNEEGWTESRQRENKERGEIAAQTEGGSRRWSLSRRNSSQASSPIDIKQNPESQGLNTSPAGGNESVKPFPPLLEEDSHGTHVIGQKNTDHALHPKKRVALDTIETNPSSEESVNAEKLPLNGQSELRSQEPNREWYAHPPKLPWTTSTLIGLKAFWKWFLTIPGFLITIYGLNVVAWGGMLFLLLCNAAPAMCHPTCNDLYSPRRIWIEIDSQILNALFCVTGFGLAPWRFRDLFWWCRWRLGRKAETKQNALRRLAGIHRGWFRLPESNELDSSGTAQIDADNPAVPIPLYKAPPPPLTGVRALPTRPWTMDFVIWMNVWNTFFQCCLCGFMWGMNRYNRPSWSTGLFVALACTVAGLGGVMMFIEGKKVKKVEGIPVSAEERKVRGLPIQDEETGKPLGKETAEKGAEAPERKKWTQKFNDVM
jgi:hypothetical protein